MATATEAHLPALDHHHREEVGRELQATLVSHGSQITPVDAGALDTDTATRELVERLADVTERIRGRMDRLGEIDLASQDVLIEVVRELEKQLWMLRSSLPA